MSGVGRIRDVALRVAKQRDPCAFAARGARVRDQRAALERGDGPPVRSRCLGRMVPDHDALIGQLEQLRRSVTDLEGFCS